MSDYVNEPPTPPGATPYEPVSGAPYPGTMPPPSGYPGAPFVPGAAPVPGAPNPALAAILGFIPGVGAMYNGQFAKGIAHIAIFAIFESLANHVNDIFGIFVAGWVFYMAIEAYQTARARRDGLPLPDPFGLNTIGERFGFKGNPDWNSFWHPSQPPMAGAPPIAENTHVDPVTGAVHYTRTGAAGAQATYQVDPAGQVYASAYAPPPGAGAAPGYAPPVPPPPGYSPYAPPAPPPYYAAAYGVPAYGVPPVPTGAQSGSLANRSGLPTGALWLIGLGVLALLGSLRPFRFLEGEATGGLFLIGISVLIFFRTGFRSVAFPPGSPEARWHTVRAARGAGVVFITGLLTLLQGLHVIGWSSSWPFLLIFIGVALVIERVALNTMNSTVYTGAGYPVHPVPQAQPAATPVQTVSPTSITPTGTLKPINDPGIHPDTGHEGGR